ncbi:DUF1592 domain-containing protein [Luteolibacter sp. AS25]|uniref:DUF1592 domain-containing protein n=1 Tax=Luteolibacter sp. AS25 TaxID=3135776 RepID=UPI00398AEF99
MNPKNLLRSILLFWIIALVSCKKTDNQAGEIIEQDEAPPLIVAMNFSLGCFVEELVDGNAVKVINLVPPGENPETYTPTALMLNEIKTTNALVLVTGKEPNWMSVLPEKTKVVNLLPEGSATFGPAADPNQALEIFENVRKEITETFPELQIDPGADEFRTKLVKNKVVWNKFLETIKLPKGLKDGVIRPSGEADFLSLVEENVRLLEKESAEFANRSFYEHTILPILDRSCIECHDEASQEGDLNLELYLTEDLASLKPSVWEKVAQVVKLEQMPPPKKEKLQLSEDERSQLYSWSKSLSEKWDAGQMGTDPGRTTIHRLNKNEYNYTIRDLFGLKIRPADNFPEDGSGESGFDNNADTLFLPALLVENYFEAAGVIVAEIYADPSLRRRYIISRPAGNVSADEAAEKILRHWSSFIYRKPANEEEVARLVSLFRKEAEQKNFDEAMQMPLYAMLISPNFLYRSSLTEPAEDPQPIEDFELASRLSYFLWSSMPDRELFKLASEGKLQDPAVFEAQVKRMLLDDKSKTLGMHFGGQWFGWEELRSSANPDQEKYPGFTFQIRVLLYQESMMFFNDLLQNNGSINSFLNSDYTFLNDTLAKFYRIPGVEGSQLRRVKLTDKNRGGVLGMGSVLTATSIPLRSSPSIRGAFVVRDILGIPLPEPPMNVEQLPEDDREVHGKTFRDSLEQHREDVNCKSCHAMIDPIGFGLEAFDAIGRFRTSQNGIPLDTNGTMPDGSSFAGPAELKVALMKQKEPFTRNMVSKILTYAIGRDITPYDRPVIKEITDKVIADNGSIHTAFIEVAKSYPFRFRRGDSYKPKTPKPTLE